MERSGKCNLSQYFLASEKVLLLGFFGFPSSHTHYDLPKAPKLGRAKKSLVSSSRSLQYAFGT